MTDFTIYSWRPKENAKRPSWRKRRVIDDVPLEAELREGAFPGYVRPISPDSLVNVKFNKNTEELTLNWSFSYGIINKNAKACKAVELAENHKTVKNAIYYELYDKGGIIFFAVVPNNS